MKQFRWTLYRKAIRDLLISGDSVNVVKSFLAMNRQQAAKRQGWTALDLERTIDDDNREVDNIAARLRKEGRIE